MITLSELRMHIAMWADTSRSLEDVEWWVDFLTAWCNLPQEDQRDVGKLLWGQRVALKRREQLEQMLLKELNR
jgi:hypothetical protein